MLGQIDYIEKSFHRKKLNIADIEDTIMQHNMANPLSLTTKSKTDSLDESIKQEKERSNPLAQSSKHKVNNRNSNAFDMKSLSVVSMKQMPPARDPSKS